LKSIVQMETEVSQAMFQTVYPWVKNSITEIRWMLAEPELPIFMETISKVHVFIHCS